MEALAGVIDDKNRQRPASPAFFFAVSIGLAVILYMAERRRLKKDEMIASMLKQMNKHCADNPGQAQEMVAAGNNIPGTGGVFHLDGSEIVFLKPHHE